MKDFLRRLKKFYYHIVQIALENNSNFLTLVVNNMKLSAKYDTSNCFVQTWVVLNSDTIQIYKGCQYGFTPLNSTEDKSDWTFEEKIVDYGYELRCKGLFSVKNWGADKYLETFSNFSLETPQLTFF